METIDSVFVTALYKEGFKGQELVKRLKENGFDEQTIEACLTYAKKLHYAHLQKIGVKFLGLGVFFCASSGLFTFIYNHSDTYANLILFGFTGIGACLILAGLAYIFGL
jgi:hypothetical protein